MDSTKLNQFLAALRPELTNVDWTALARKVLIENPQTAWRELPGRLQNATDLLSQYNPGGLLPNQPPTPPEVQEQLLGMAMDKGMAFAPMGMTKAVKTEFEKALKTAQKNAAKPISEGGLGLPKNNTAADRAAAMGFDTPVYHGTAEEIFAIDPSKFGTTTGAKTGKAAFWASDSPEVARTYAEFAAKNAKIQKLVDKAYEAEKRGNWDLYDDYLRQAEELESSLAKEYGSGQTIMPMLIKSKNLGLRDIEGKSFDDFGVSDEILEAILASKKYDKTSGVAFQNLDDAIGQTNLLATHYAITDPTAIRSRFAAFDPMRAKEASILAGMFPLTIGGLLGSSEGE